MPRQERHEPGTFCWVELLTTDVAAAKKFYSELFGWQYRDEPMGPDSHYTMLLKEGDAVGGLYKRTAEQQQRQVSPHWAPYVAVEDVNHAVKRVRDFKGQILGEPRDISDEGRTVVLADPTGATLNLWQAKKYAGFQRTGEPGTLAWSELLTNDVKKAARFYDDLFGWKHQTQDMGGTQYTVFSLGDRMVAGMMAIDPAWGQVPPNWISYFQVKDCAESEKRARAAGGKVMKETTEIDKETGFFAVIEDPQGIPFGIFQMANRR